jgi:hypothetical protein
VKSIAVLLTVVVRIFLGMTFIFDASYGRKNEKQVKKYFV